MIMSSVEPYNCFNAMPVFTHNLHNDFLFQKIAFLENNLNKWMSKCEEMHNKQMFLEKENHEIKLSNNSLLHDNTKLKEERDTLKQTIANMYSNKNQYGNSNNQGLSISIPLAHNHGMVGYQQMYSPSPSSQGSPSNMFRHGL